MTISPWSGRLIAKYAALQVPGWLALLAIILVARAIWPFPGWVVWAALALALIKDIVMYPILWRSYAGDRLSAVEPRVGAVGVVERELSHEGYVRVRGELWRAVLAPNEPPLAAGSRARIEAVDGLTLIVRGERPGGSPTS